MAPTSGNPKAQKKEAPPFHPGSACGYYREKRKRSASQTVCHERKKANEDQ